MMLLRKWVLSLGVAGVALGLAGCPGGSSDTTMVGFYGDLTGSKATFGTSSKEGVELALDEINAQPPLGKKLEVRYEDNQGKAEQSVSVVTKLITQDKVVAVLGEIASTNSMAAAPVCQSNSIPMISPASTNPKVTQTGDYIFRVCFIDPFQGKVLAKFAKEKLNAKTAAILWDVKNDYSKGLKDFFKRTFTEEGGRIVAEPSFAEGDSDFNAQLNAIKQANPDVLMVPGYYTEVGTIARQARDLGIKAPMLGGDGWDSPQLFEGAGAALAPAYMSNHYSAESDDPRVQEFITKYKAKFGGKVPDAMAALGYDSAKVLADAITRAGSTEPKAIRDALAAVKDFPAVTGSVTLDAERNANKPAVVLQAQGKTWKYVETVKP